MSPTLVHICDHSNAIYARDVRGIPIVTTCHDLLAVRGALGEKTDCPASFTGKLLQRRILAGLETTTAIGCVSQATLADVDRLVTRHNGMPKIELITLGLNYPYRQLSQEEAHSRLSDYPVLKSGREFVLHVGSNLPRKNREGVLRIFDQCKDKWSGLLVIAGEPLSNGLRSAAKQLGILDRIIEIPNATSELLEALYSCATALLFPSTFEGFGWPIAEAQACGCPVICTDREPMTEVAGTAGLRHDIGDEAGFAADLLHLTNQEQRQHWSAKGLENARRFSSEEMIAKYRELYRSLASI